MRTASISNGKFMDAVMWAKEVSGYVEKKHGTPKIHTWVDSFGQVGTMRWTMDAPDLSTIEKVQTAILADADYWKLLGKAAQQQLFIDGSTVDVVSRAL
jgi:hypothetical protein